MQVFMSWSGEVSREVAENLATFIEHVVRGINTFISSHDVDAGERWETRVSEELEQTHHAILCITRKNQESTWLNYEAGALGKLLGRSKVIPYTLGFHPGEMGVGPLSRFQGIQNDKEGTWALVLALNNALQTPNGEAFVREDFDLWWPRLEPKMSETLSQQPAKKEQYLPTDREILLELRRDIQLLLRSESDQQFQDIGTAKDILKQSIRDPLTNLSDRRAFNDRASELSATNTPYVIGYLDLDNFKMINDTLGHAKGDALLAIIASAMEGYFQSADFLARLGGDEFGVIFASTTPDQVAKMLNDFIAVLPNCATDNGFPSITASGGVSSDRIEPPEDKLRDADLAMFQSKSEGRGKITVFLNRNSQES